MTDDGDRALSDRLSAAALAQAEYQKTEAERKIKLAEAEELAAGGSGDQPDERDAPEPSEGNQHGDNNSAGRT